jgi:hypothetical protein
MDITEQSSVITGWVHSSEPAGTNHDMGMDPALRRLVERIHEQASTRFDELHPSSVRQARGRVSLLLGFASALMALAVALMTVIGLLGIPYEPWCEQRVVMTEAPRQSDAFDETESNFSSTRPGRVATTTIHLPSLHGRAMACVAEVLGIGGLVLGWRRGRAFWLSAVGVLLALLSMMPVIACEVFLTIR